MNESHYANAAFQSRCAALFFLTDCSVVEFQETIERADSSTIVMEDCSVQTGHAKRIHFYIVQHIAKMSIGWFLCEFQTQKLLCHRAHTAQCPLFDSR